MSQPQAILDYASPGRAGKLRIGSTSVIRIFDRGEVVQIVETLEERGKATALILVDLGMIAVMFAGNQRGIARSFARGTLDEILAFTLVLAVAMLAILFFALLHNFASTRLAATGESLTLTFSNPIRKRVYAIPRISVHTIEVRTSEAVNELRIFVSMHDLHLFTGHSLFELARIAALLIRALNLGEQMDQAVPYANFATPE